MGEGGHHRLTVPAEPLLRRAAADVTVAADVAVVEPVTLIVRIVTVTEHHRDPAGRLFAPAVAGISPVR